MDKFHNVACVTRVAAKTRQQINSAVRSSLKAELRRELEGLTSTQNEKQELLNRLNAVSQRLEYLWVLVNQCPQDLEEVLEEYNSLEKSWVDMIETLRGL